MASFDAQMSKGLDTIFAKFGTTASLVRSPASSSGYDPTTGKGTLVDPPVPQTVVVLLGTKDVTNAKGVTEIVSTAELREPVVRGDRLAIGTTTYTIKSVKEEIGQNITLSYKAEIST